MRLLFNSIAIAGCLTAASAAQAVPLFYDEARSGDIVATIDNIPVFNLGVGANVIAGNQSFGGNFSPFDGDLFSFLVPQNSVLSFVTIEFGAFSFTGSPLAFGPNYAIGRDIFTGTGRFLANSRTATSNFTDVLSSVGPQNLFTQLPLGSGLYDWVDGAGLTVNQLSDLATTGAMWDYRLTFGVDRIAVPEPAPLALLGFGVLALFVRRRASRSAF